MSQILPDADRIEIRPLTGIRAFAALWVVLFHTAYALPSTFPALHWFARLGFLGVDLFFVLSGFVISYNYWHRFSPFSFMAYRSFLWVRLARIYPVHLFTLLVSLMFLWGVRFSGIATTKSFSTWTLTNFLTNCGLVHAWRPYYVESWNNASWSVSCEWFAYLVFPLLVVVGLKRIQVPLALLTAVLLPMIPAFMSQAQWNVPFALLLRVLCCFAAGCLLFHVYKRMSEYPRLLRFIKYGALALLVAVLSVLWIFRGLAADWMALAFPFVILGLAQSSGVVGKFFGSKSATYWGRVSYSLYMTHNVTLWLLKALLPIAPGSTNVLRLAVYFLCIGVIAALTYHLVEEPARKWMRARTRQQTDRRMELGAGEPAVAITPGSE